MIDVFEEVKHMLTMQQVIDRYGANKVKRGWALCPFHLDHKPSLHVYKNSFYCFVCGAGGDLINYVARLMGISNGEAVNTLIQDFSLPLPPIDSKGKASAKARLVIERRKKAREEEERNRALIDRVGGAICDCYRQYRSVLDSEKVFSDRWCEAMDKLNMLDVWDEEFRDNPEAFYRDNKELIDGLIKASND